MAELQQKGSFNAVIVDYGLAEAESGSVGVNIRCKIEAAYNPDTGSYDDWTQYEEQFVDGTLWVIKKDKTPNATAVEGLCRHAGWDGSFDSIANKTWEPTPCRIDVSDDTYKDRTRYRVNWLAAHGSTPGGMGNVDVTKAKGLQAQYGGSLRAIAGAFTHDAKPSGAAKKPKSPPPPKAAPVAAGATQAGPDGIPF